MPEPPPYLLKAKTPPMVLLPLATNKVLDRSNSHPSDTNPALKFQVNTKLLLLVSHNFRSMVTTIFNTLAIRLRLMDLQTRCTVNVITPSFCILSELANISSR